ncbi:MAG: T9SS type A sorting domain-containing protein, partial [Polaribacter sp.]|nr:T9SS type A sorting domain-containing protein [Polaribacter sp.]
FINRSTLDTGSFKVIDDTLFKVFPNPSMETIKIELVNINSVPVEIYTITGKLIKKIPSYKYKQPINISNFSKGIYILKINGKPQKFIKI